MSAIHESLIDDLEHILADKPIGDRARMLRRVTDLFVISSGKLSGEQVALFEEVMGRLLEEIEVSARAAFGHTLATIPDAPPRIVQRLALDDVSDVACPVLRHSKQLDDTTLIQTASTKSQAHLLAISQREKLAKPITDVLVLRGNEQVAMSAASNPGAAFSDFGYSTLVRRSLDDDSLATCVWSRPEIPRQHLLKLFAEASENVRRKLTGQDPSKAKIILEIVAQASHTIQDKAREWSLGYIAALAHVRSLHDAGELDEAKLAEFARADQFDDLTIGLSLVSDLPIAVIDRAFAVDRPEQIIVIAKAVGLSWDTVKCILLLQRDARNVPVLDISRCFKTYARLKSETAIKALRFYRLRERATTQRLD